MNIYVHKVDVCIFKMYIYIILNDFKFFNHLSNNPQFAFCSHIHLKEER